MLRNEEFYRSSECCANLSILARAWCLGHSVTCLILQNVSLTKCYCIHYVICTGKPSTSIYSEDPDFVPTIFECAKRTEVQDQQKGARKRRCQENDGVKEMTVPCWRSISLKFLHLYYANKCMFHAHANHIVHWTLKKDLSERLIRTVICDRDLYVRHELR